MVYDVAVIGGGPGGYSAAVKASQMGGKVLLIEKEHLGGTCLNKGCIPTKTLLKCSKLYKSIKDAARFGIKVEGASIDFGSMMARKDEVVLTLRNGLKGLMKRNGVEVITGEGHIAAPGRVSVDNEMFEAKNIIIATGSRSIHPKIEGIESGNVADSEALLNAKELPSSIVIIGGGVIGLEFALLFSELGTAVTIIEMMESILSMADEDVIKGTEKILKDNSIKYETAAKVVKINGNEVCYQKNGQCYSVSGDKILIASGRAPNTDVSVLDRLGIRHDRGRILTDKHMKTNVQGIYAIGDVNGKAMLAHTAYAEAHIAVDNIFGIPSEMNYSIIPSCIYLHPEISWTGLTEKEARSKGFDIVTEMLPIGGNGRAHAEGETFGMIKIICNARDGEILGVHMICPGSSDMISECSVAMGMEATAEELARAVHPHPSFSETLMEAAIAISRKLNLKA
jgi:dihydrolipoamide dehydrogenase